MQKCISYIHSHPCCRAGHRRRQKHKLQLIFQTTITSRFTYTTRDENINCNRDGLVKSRHSKEFAGKRLDLYRGKK